MLTQIIRRTIQVSGIVLIIFIPFLSLDFNISDPLTFIGNIFGSGKFYFTLFVSILPLVIITAALGRVYCGWICPMNLIFELNGKIRKILIKIGVKPFNVSFARLNKYALLIVGAALSMILGVQVFSFIYPPIIFNREVIHLIYFGSVGTGAVVLVTIFLFEISISQRAWCRYFCPGGALWSLLGAKRVLNITIDREICDDCGKCNLACEFGLDPMRGRMGMECDNCGKCISKCKPDALKYSMIFPWQKKSIIRRRRHHKEDKELNLASN
ncbi:MAG: 4Fe-4S binding protein [Deltaproteobacteria bacterium]|nr:4Fe-4S binding protein [Deltaproteobacteria bacterium]